MEEKSREEEIRKIWKDYRLFYKLLGAAALVGIGVLAGRWIYAAPDAQQAWGYGVNLYTSIISIAVTVLILDELNRRRSEQDAEAALKRQLIDDAASISNEVAKNAVHQLRRKGWLEGENGLLEGADLQRANLQGAYLVKANLNRVMLYFSNLSDANLSYVSLQGAELAYVQLERAELNGANLRGADLHNANLQNAQMASINLKGANLNGADIQGAWSIKYFLLGSDFVEPFDRETILPDGSHWTPETNIDRFTDSSHPDFWHPLG